MLTDKPSWSGPFGDAYLRRNSSTLEVLEERCRSLYGVSRSDMNYVSLYSYPRGMSILEVGCGDGRQLQCLRRMGFTKLYGVDVNKEAVASAGQADDRISVVVSDARQLAFEDEHFGLVFTSGLLIHVVADDLARIMEEMYRCTNRYIWGFEYFSTDEQEIKYRGYYNMLWKRNHSMLWQKNFGMKLRSETFYWRSDGAGFDTMYLLQK